jgi:two-component system chemotaxis response regulator CheY
MTDSNQTGSATAPPIDVLLVDDSATMRALIKRAIGLSGVPIGRIYEAGDGRQALALLEAEHVDVLFTDINMPVMTGIELLQRIAGSDRWRELVRVVISTDGSDARRAEVERLHVRHYVNKPFRPELLRDVLSDCHVSHAH